MLVAQQNWTDPAALTLVGAAIGALIVKAGPFVLNLLRLRTKEQESKQKFEKEGYFQTIDRQDKRIVVLENEIVKIRIEAAAEREKHVQCLIEQTRLREQLAHMTLRLEDADKRIAELTRRLELLRPSDPIRKMPPV